MTYRDETGYYVVPNLLIPMDLVLRPDLFSNLYSHIRYHPLEVRTSYHIDDRNFHEQENDVLCSIWHSSSLVDYFNVNFVTKYLAF